MGKKLRDEDLKLNIIVNGDKAKKELGDLEKSTRELTTRNKELRAEKNKLERAGKKESDRYREVTRELRENNKAIKTNETRMTELRKQIGLTGLTYKQLRTEQTRLRRLMDSSTYGTDNWKKYRAELEKVEAQMAVVRAGSNRMRFSIKNLADGFNKYFGIISAAIATLTGVAFSVKEWTKGLVGLDDTLADVMKTTGLTRREVRDLYTDFRYLNTRTARKELLLYAEEAGRLNKKTSQDVMDFVKVANMIGVALGDDLGGNAEEATREVGKLTDNLNVGQEYGVGFGEAMEKAGSGINELAANSKAQAGYIIEFTKRTQGLGEQARISAADLFGLGATFDEGAQAVEMSATAVNKVIVDMFRDTSDYAKVANMSVREFADLLNTDANAAFIKMLEGLEGNNLGLAVMVKKFDAMGIDGSRATQALASLVGNLDRLAINQKIANKAMADGTSLSNEYNIKNNNLAGSMDKIGRAIRSKFINSGLLEWMEKIVTKAAEWTEVPLSDKIREEQTELNLLVASVTNANNTQETRNTLIDELQKKYPDFLGNLDAEKVTNEELRDRLIEVNEQYENKILLAVKEEKLQANYKERTDLKLEELRIIKDIAKYEEIANKAREKAANVTDPNKFRALLTDEEITALNAMDLLPRKLEDIRTRFGELLNDEAQLNEAIRGLMTGNGTSSAGGNSGGGTVPSGTGGNTGAAGAFSSEPEKEDPLAVESWMTSDKWDTYGAEELAARKASEQEWTEFLNKEVQKRIDAVSKELEIEQEIAEARVELKEIQVAAISELAGSLASMFDQGSAAQIAMIGIEKAVAIAQIWMNLAKEKSTISLAARKLDLALPGSGLAWEAAMIAKAVTAAKINTGLVVAQTVGAAVSSKKRKKTEAYAEGKYPVPLRTGTYGSRPHYALFNEVPGYPEMVVDGKTFKTMQMNYPELINAIYSIRDGRTPRGYADGKYDNDPQDPTQPYTDFSAMIAEIKEHNERTVEEIRKIKIYTAIEDVNDGQKRYTEIQETRGIS